MNKIFDLAKIIFSISILLLSSALIITLMALLIESTYQDNDISKGLILLAEYAITGGTGGLVIGFCTLLLGVFAGIAKEIVELFS